MSKNQWEQTRETDAQRLQILELLDMISGQNIFAITIMFSLVNYKGTY